MRRAQVSKATAQMSGPMGESSRAARVPVGPQVFSAVARVAVYAGALACAAVLLLIVGFAAIFKASLEYTVTNHRFVSAVLHYPNSVKYAVVPLSMALMVIKSLERTVVDFKKLMKNG